MWGMARRGEAPGAAGSGATQMASCVVTEVGRASGAACRHGVLRLRSALPHPVQDDNSGEVERQELFGVVQSLPGELRHENCLLGCLCYAGCEFGG